MIERTLTREARVDAETQRVRERKRSRVERGAGDVPLEPGNRDDEQMAVGKTPSTETSTLAKEDQRQQVKNKRNKWRKTVRLEQEFRDASASSDPTVTLEHPGSGEPQSRPGSVLVQK